MQPNARTWEQLIHSAEDLITTRRATRDGFLLQAQKKTEKAIPFVQQAQEFEIALQAVEGVEKLLNLPQFRDELIAAAGFSEKAQSYFTESELHDELVQILNNLYNEAREAFGAESEEKVYWAFRQGILYRFILTKGDALGGQMRNITGALASEKLARALLEALQPQEVEVKASSESGKIQRISWKGRLLLFDTTPQLIIDGKKQKLNNIDIILIDTSFLNSTGGLPQQDPSRYLACGELKGGIDPAGADEHWKTANKALGRIRDVFVKQCHVNCPALFFIGAAIEPKMAHEIYTQLKSGELTYAANLTVSEQVSSCAKWLVSL